MRLKEPFRGLNMVGGHSIFHFALLIVSLVVLSFPEGGENKENKEYLYTINLLRCAHAVDVFFGILKFLGSTPKNYAKHCFTFKILDTIKMFFYLCSILFAIFHETQPETADALKNKDWWIRHAEVFILIELVIFFSQILCSTFFLIGLQIRGELGYNNDPNFQRFKYDTLTYYQDDIAWFSYMFVNLCLHLEIMLKHWAVPAREDNDLKLIFSFYMIAVCCLKMYLLMPYRGCDRKLTVIDNKKWGVLFGAHLLSCIPFFIFKVVKGSSTLASMLIDTIVLLGMFTLYKINEAKNQDPPDLQQPLMKCFGNT